MDLSKAVTKALKFVPKESNNPLLQCVRLLPEHGGAPARVMATDGEVTFLAHVEGDLPNALLPASAMSPAAKASIQDITPMDSGRYKVVGGAGSFQLAGESVQGYPGFPDIPTLKWWSDWDQVEKVLHAAASLKADPKPLKCLHMTPEYVECCDRFRISRVWCETGTTDELLPMGVFKHWPKGPVSIARDASHVFFQAKDEIRIVQLFRTEKFPDLQVRLPEIYTGQYWIVAPKVLLELTKQATTFSAAKVVNLNFQKGAIEIGAWQDTAEVPFSGVVEAVAGLTPGAVKLEGGSILLNGKHLQDALKVVDTPKVRLCYCGPLEPLRLESGGVVECLFPLLAKGV